MSKDELDRWVRFYRGEWPGAGRLFNLAGKFRKSGKFIKIVKRSFFEEALWNAEYGMGKKLIFAWCMLLGGGFKFFFFRVINASKKVPVQINAPDQKSRTKVF